MTIIEYQNLIELVNEYQNININFLIDLAYLDFSRNDYREEVLPLFKQLKEHVDIYLAFSGSKSFGVYGLRMGALIYLTKEKEKSNLFKKSIDSKTGAIQGLPNSLSILLFNEIINNEDVYNEQQTAKEILQNRSLVLLEELRKNKIDYFPYSSGFFLTIKEENPLKMTKRLKNNNVYVVPTNQGLRIALSAIIEKEIIQLVKIIKECR